MRRRRLELARKRRARELEGLDPGLIDVDALASALAERLAAVVPAQIDVTVDSGRVWVRNAQGSRVISDVAFLTSVDDESTDERIRRAAEHALDTAQEMIAEETTEPWPSKAGEVPGGFAFANADIVGEQVLLFYGNPGSPVLELAPIDLSDVRLLVE